RETDVHDHAIDGIRRVHLRERLSGDLLVLSDSRPRIAAKGRVLPGGDLDPGDASLCRRCGNEAKREREHRAATEDRSRTCHEIPPPMSRIARPLRPREASGQVAPRQGETKRNGGSGVRRRCNFTPPRRMACCASTECVPSGRRRYTMPEKETIERAHKDAAQGKSASTQAGEFVREEMHHVREGKHGARSPKQAIAIGLSKARRAGVKLQAPRAGKASPQTRRKAARDVAKGRRRRRPSARRSRAVRRALKREPRSSA